ncbi:unnamed protein product, partial [marine sediment metagenome]
INIMTIVMLRRIISAMGTYLSIMHLALLIAQLVAELLVVILIVTEIAMVAMLIGMTLVMLERV